jgi:hypothetical protein
MIQYQLHKIGEKHKHWCQLVERMGCNKCDIEDVVQDSYIRIHYYLEQGKDIRYGEDDINEFYMYMTLRSVYMNGLNKKGLEFQDMSSTENLDDALNGLAAEYADVEESEAYTKLINRIFSEVNTWDFYNKNIFIAYFTSSLSLDKLSNDTKIGRSSLYNSIRKHRDIIIEMFSEDAQDYYNKDYDKL